MYKSSDILKISYSVVLLSGTVFNIKVYKSAQYMVIPNL